MRAGRHFGEVHVHAQAGGVDVIEQIAPAPDADFDFLRRIGGQDDAARNVVIMDTDAEFLLHLAFELREEILRVLVLPARRATRGKRRRPTRRAWAANS